MNDDRLRLDLAALADEVTPVDLRDRALRTSRRIGIQRAVATSAAVLVLIGAATGTALAVRPDASAPGPLPADSPSITFTPPSPTTSAAPTTSPSSPADASGSSASTGTLGRLFYGPAKVTEQETATLRSWRPGEDPISLLRIPEIAAISNASISPDGRRIAWVERDDKNATTLFVAEVDGSDRKPVRSDVDEYCVTPTWSPDSRRLLFRTQGPTGEPGRYGVLDTRGDGGTVRWWTDQPEACHPLWSADGRTIAMNTDAGVGMYDTDGKKRRAVPGLAVSADWRSNHVTSLAPDGSRIALLRKKPGEEAGDVGRDLRVNAVLETGTGRAVDLPLGGRSLKQVYFRSDGSMVARVQSGDGFALLLIGADGRKASETAEPASLKGMQIIAAVD